MARTMHPHSQIHHLMTPRTLCQKTCIGLGIAFMLLGIGGIMKPDLLGMHLSFLHNVIHLLAGGLALWSGYADDFKKAYNFSIAFGVFFGLLGLAGFVLGEPGFTGVGHLQADEYLFRIVPNALEFGTLDHSVHLLISFGLIASAYLWKKSNDALGRITVQVQARDGFDPENSVTDLKNASLGRSDVQMKSDNKRRTEFEGRL